MAKERINHRDTEFTEKEDFFYLGRKDICYCGKRKDKPQRHKVHGGRRV